jgi:hypothetical protein
VKRNAWLTALFVTLATAMLGTALTLFASGRFQWGAPEIPKAQGEAFVVSPEAAIPQYQARVASAIIREPKNTWSNLAFVFVGALIAAHDRRMFARLLGAALCGLGLASGLYHASLLPAWRTVDVATMGWVTFALGCVGISAVWRDKLDSVARFYPGIGAAGSVLAMLAAVFRNDVKLAGIKPFDSTYTTVAGVAFISFLLLAAFLSRQERPSWSRLSLIAGGVGLAIACQLGDHPRRWFSNPESAVQAHAVWHVLMAAAVALTYDTFAVLEGRTSLWPRAI